MWKKEDELKQLKSELAALDRKIQLELAPPTPETGEKEKDGQQVQPMTEDARQVRSPADGRNPAEENIADRSIVGRPGFQPRDDNRPKGIKM